MVEGKEDLWKLQDELKRTICLWKLKKKPLGRKRSK